jgi:hypothetical protein
MADTHYLSNEEKEDMMLKVVNRARVAQYRAERKALVAKAEVDYMLRLVTLAHKYPEV